MAETLTNCLPPGSCLRHSGKPKGSEVQGNAMKPSRTFARKAVVIKIIGSKLDTRYRPTVLPIQELNALSEAVERKLPHNLLGTRSRVRRSRR
jgi:hypothetical protein